MVCADVNEKGVDVKKKWSDVLYSSSVVMDSFIYTKNIEYRMIERLTKNTVHREHTITHSYSNVHGAFLLQLVSGLF